MQQQIAACELTPAAVLRHRTIDAIVRCLSRISHPLQKERHRGAQHEATLLLLQIDLVQQILHGLSPHAICQQSASIKRRSVLFTSKAICQNRPINHKQPQIACELTSSLAAHQVVSRSSCAFSSSYRLSPGKSKGKSGQNEYRPCGLLLQSQAICQQKA